MKPAACGRRCAAVALLVSAVLRPGWSAEVPPADEIVPLDPLVVADRRAARRPSVDEEWLRARVGEFEAFSSTGAKPTERYLRTFYEFHLLFRELFPHWNAARGAVPTLVLCDRRTFDAIQPRFSSDDERKRSMSFYGRHGDLATIVLDLEAEGALLDDTLRMRTATGSELLGGEPDAFQREEVDPIAQVRREYVRFVLSQGGKRAPAWMEEGLAQLLAITEIDEKGTLRFGRLKRELVGSLVSAVDGRPASGAAAGSVSAQVNDQGRGSGGGDFGDLRNLGSMESVDALALYFNRLGFIPFGEFFRTRHEDEDARSIVGGQFGMQSLAFLHYCLYGQNGKRQEAFVKFVERLQHEEFSEELFAECFGRTCKQAQGDLRGYLGGARYRAVYSKNFKLPPVPAIELRAATPTEWLRAKADALRFAGRTADAAAVLQTAVDLGFVDARLYASVGFLQRERGNEPAALVAFRNAVTAKTTLPGPYVAVAAARLDAALAAAGEGPLPKEEFVAIMRLVMAARERVPAPRRDLYEVAARAWLRAPAKPKNENLGLLEEGVLAFPSCVPLVAATAELKHRIGRETDAHQLALLGQRVAQTPEDRARFDALADVTKAAASPAVR